MKTRSLIMIVAAFSTFAAALPSLAKEKEEPKKEKFPYNNIPVEVSCFAGQHPTQGPNGPEFPCINDAETVAPPKPATATSTGQAQTVIKR